jgi:ubiquinone/menaquinone biosynthesis C-methylase UbiE
MIGLNCGSGQRPFDREQGWCNIDINPRWNPDVLGHWNNLTPFEDNSVDLVVSHHSLEHVGCGEGSGFVTEAYRVLKTGGSLLVFVPEMRKLANMWLRGELTEQLYMTNVYGAYMGDEADRHKWGYSQQGLGEYLSRTASFREVRPFDWRPIAGADIARDDRWILGMEAVK